MSTVLILGGCGFIGRNLVDFLKEQGVAKKVRVADKSMPDLAGLSEAQRELYKSDFVDYVQANLSNPRMIEKAFKEDFGPWDVIVNLASETKYSQSEEVYKENIIDVAEKCAAEAKKHTFKCWVEISTAQVYDAGKKPSNESSKIKPWTKMAAAKLEAEKKITAAGIPYVVLRTAVVYGPGDIFGITPRIVCAATYTKTGEKMEFLWDKDLKVNTVHVSDVVRAIWHVANNSDCKGKVYNLADKNNTDQGSINAHLEKIFGIKTGFLGNMKSKVATAMAMKTVAETANDKHLGPWGDLCKEKGISFTPLTPYLDEELLYNNSMSVDGSEIEKTGFSYSVPQMTEQHLRDVVKYFVQNKAFPDGLTK